MPVERNTASSTSRDGTLLLNNTHEGADKTFALNVPPNLDLTTLRNSVSVPWKLELKEMWAVGVYVVEHSVKFARKSITETTIRSSSVKETRPSLQNIYYFHYSLR